MPSLIDWALDLLSPGRRKALEAADRAELARQHRDQVIDDERDKTDIRWRLTDCGSGKAVVRGVNELEEAERHGLGG